MTKAFSQLEILILEWVSADYESFSSIKGNLAAHVGKQLSQKEILETLLGLQERGLVESFVYDRSAQRYEERSVESDMPTENYCWLATMAGQRIGGMEPDGP